VDAVNVVLITVETDVTSALWNSTGKYFRL